MPKITEMFTCFRKLFCYMLGCFFAALMCCKLLIDFLRSPLRFSRETFFKQRNVMPSCLNDPSLGSHRFIHLDNVKLHYVTCGDETKPLILLLHGFPGFWFSWKYQIQEFSKDYRVVAVDQRGYSDSDKPSGWRNYTISKLSEDIRQLIPALGHRSCTLIGHDWGGVVAWHMACHHPQMVDRLVVLNAPNMAVMEKYLYTSPSQFLKSWYMFFFQVPVIPELVVLANDMKFIAKYFDKMPNNSLSQEEMEAYKYAFSAKGAVTSPINWYRAMIGQGTRTMPVFQNPALVLFGIPEFALNPELAYMSKQYASDLTVKLIHNSHHNVQIDKHRECNTEIRQFLRK